MTDQPRGMARFEIPGRLVRWLGVGLVVAYAAVVAVYLASGLALEAWDDSYFFKRIGPGTWPTARCTGTRRKGSSWSRSSRC
jgi:hypothetical protein